jgi:hypothetical protein
MRQFAHSCKNTGMGHWQACSRPRPEKLQDVERKTQPRMYAIVHVMPAVGVRSEFAARSSFRSPGHETKI